MKEFDREGLEFAEFQGRVFTESLERSQTSSPIFLRRFFLSDFVYRIDQIPAVLLAMDVNEAFREIDKQYGPSNYGKTKYDADALYWLGYFLRYICYTREISSRLAYRLFDVNEIYSSYAIYHTQNEEWCLAHLLSEYGYTEKIFDPNERFKALLREDYAKEHGR